MKAYAKGTLKVFSGKCCLCDVGIPTGAKSTWGDPIEIHTGDIVIIWRGSYIGTDFEEWVPSAGLTVVVSENYQSYNGGVEIEAIGPGTPYPMGIKSCGFNHPEWRVQVVKKYSDVVPGERWPNFGFSYQFSDLADAAIDRIGAEGGE